jgi:hypothetical protein
VDGASSVSDFTAVIPHYGSYALLRSCLSSLLKGSIEKIVVVEDGCYDDAIRKDFPRIQFEHLRSNVGFAAACNRGLELTETPYVGLLNNDVQVTTEWHLPLLDVLRRNPDVAICQPKIMSARDPNRFDYAGGAGGFIDQYGYPFCRGRIFDVLEVDRGQYDTPSELFWASGAAFVGRTEDIRRAGAFNPDFFAYMEEIDLCWRLHNLGKRILYVPESVVYHEGSATWASMPERKAYLLHRNNLLMLRRNYSRHDLRSTLWIRLLLEVASAAFFLMGGERPRARAILRALAWNLTHFSDQKERGRGEGARYPGTMARREDLSCIYRGSIAVRHFLGGVREFSDLGWEAPASSSREAAQPEYHLDSG